MVTLLHHTTDGRILWYCVACGRPHGGQGWTWNGNADRPTLSPSFLVRSGHYIPGHPGDCWCTWNAAHPDEPSGFDCRICHTFVREGQILYLPDCTHAYAGQTVSMVAF